MPPPGLAHKISQVSRRGTFIQSTDWILAHWNPHAEDVEFLSSWIPE